MNGALSAISNRIQTDNTDIIVGIQIKATSDKSNDGTFLFYGERKSEEK